MPAIPPYFQKKMPAISRADEGPSMSTLPIRKHNFKTPKLRIHLNNLAHEGTSIFLSNTKGNEDIETQVQNVLNLLYHADDVLPGTRSVTFVLRSMDGVAYTTGLDLDSDHKEIHFNLEYISNIGRGQRDEILGVICHELVHCFQWSAQDTCPGGLIEGIADWVRLRANLGAKHWKQKAGDSWDAGYQDTGYFLDYLEKRFGDGTVRKINGNLRVGEYDEKKVFGECCKGHKVDELFEDYKKELEKSKKATPSGEVDEYKPIPTHAVKNQANPAWI